jgi:hypothetical protein
VVFLARLAVDFRPLRLAPVRFLAAFRVAFFDPARFLAALRPVDFRAVFLGAARLLAALRPVDFREVRLAAAFLPDFLAAALLAVFFAAMVATRPPGLAPDLGRESAANVTESRLRLSM